MTKKHLILVLTEPTEGQEDDFNDYYETVHLDEVIETAGWKSAQRFKLAGQAGADCPLPYLAVYEAEGEDAATIIAGMNDTRSQRRQSDALNKNTGRVWVFEEIGPRHQG